MRCVLLELGPERPTQIGMILLENTAVVVMELTTVGGLFVNLLRALLLTVAHAMHCPEEADPEFPPVLPRYRPALQLMQDAWPAVAWTRPAALQDDPGNQIKLECS